MFGRTRRDQQSAFITGARPIMVATKGFGMGVDKQNIRLVIHRTPTENLEAYAQEAGRAGRDGKMATVILFFSPDQPAPDGGQRTPSDHEIQRFFLDGRYIRREDVVAVRALLRSVRQRLRVPHDAGSGVRELLYLTSDEAIDFLDRRSQDISTGFRWPALHRDLGEELTNAAPGKRLALRLTKLAYDQKRRYVHRILSVLQRIRPTSADIGQRVAVIQSFSEVGARVNGFRTMSWPDIRSSNMRFGHLLRDRRMSEMEFSRALQAPNLFPLAEQLSLSMRDLVTMLNDMKYAEGHRVAGREGPYWRSDLLSFSRIVAPEPSFSQSTGDTSWTVQDVPAQWLAEVGRKGWEIEPGPAFWDERRFQPYLDAFMALHNGRRSEDEDAYRRLLVDYIGVTDNGLWRDGMANGPCLRGVMLGYLQTHELVEGGNCLSCSRCVPNERFDADIEERKRVIVKLGRTVERCLASIKELASDVPSDDLMAEVVEAIGEEERSGRGLTAYVTGWTNRLLADAPDHRGALWTRLQLMVSKLVPFDAEEVGRSVLTLAERQPGLDDARRLLRMVDAMPGHLETPATLRRAEAALSRLVGDIDRELQALIAARALAASQQDRTWLPSVLGRLRSLSDLGGPAPDATRCEDVSLELAELTTDGNERRRLYASAMASWNSQRLQTYLIDLQERAQDSLSPTVIRAWLSIGGGPRAGRRFQDAASILERIDPSVLERLADDDMVSLWPYLGEHRRLGIAIQVGRRLLDRGGTDVNDTLDAIDVLTVAASANETVPSNLRQILAERFLRDLPALMQDSYAANQFMDGTLGLDILGRAATLLPHRDVATLTTWISRVRVERIVSLGDRAIVATMWAIAESLGRLSIMEAANTRATLLGAATDLRQHCEESGIGRGEVRNLWRTALSRCGDSLSGLLERCLTLEPPRSVLAHEAYAAMLAHTSSGAATRCLDRLESTLSAQMPLRFSLGRTFLDFLAEICSPPGTIATLDSGTLRQRIMSAYGAHARRAPVARRPHIADMVHAIVVSQMTARFGPRVRQPDLEIDALCQGDRFDEAGTIARQYPHIRIGKKQTPATQHVEQAAEASPDRRRTQRDTFEQDYLTILRRQV